MMRKITLVLPVLGLIAVLALSSPALAGTINLSLTNPTRIATPGAILSFTATVSAPATNTGPVFLNADSTTADYPLVLDDSSFFLNFPLFLAPGASYTGVPFTVDLPNFATSGATYNGYFEIDGGSDDNASSYLASVTFQVTAVPEPGSAILLLTGLSVLAVACLRKQRWRTKAAQESLRCNCRGAGSRLVVPGLASALRETYCQEGREESTLLAKGASATSPCA